VHNFIGCIKLNFWVSVNFVCSCKMSGHTCTWYSLYPGGLRSYIEFTGIASKQHTNIKPDVIHYRLYRQKQFIWGKVVCVYIAVSDWLMYLFRILIKNYYEWTELWFEIVTAVTTKIAAFWVVAHVDWYKFTSVSKVYTASIMTAIGQSSQWWWRRYGPLKRW
jgi:hypothetical protein